MTLLEALEQRKTGSETLSPPTQKTNSATSPCRQMPIPFDQPATGLELAGDEIPVVLDTIRKSRADIFYHQSCTIAPSLGIMSSTKPDTNGNRPSGAARHYTAPPTMAMNGHFASVGDAPTKEQYEHGIQVIDEEKEFK